MNRICELVNHVMETGHLDCQAEQRLQELLQTDYALEDFNAFMELQWAIMDGLVTQESLERYKQDLNQSS